MSSGDQISNPPLEPTTWWALTVIALGFLLIASNATIVNIALPSIAQELEFSGTGLSWVVNAYLVSFGAFLLLGGRMGDVFGHRRIYLFGVAVFAIASLACGLADGRWFLVASRCVQGFGAALVSASALTLVLTLCDRTHDRVRALGVCSCAGAIGGGLGLALGGALTAIFSWKWVFLVSVPPGFLICMLGVMLVPRPEAERRHLGMRAKAPLIDLTLFSAPNLLAANIVGALLAAAVLVWGTIGALLLQLVLRLDPLQVGLAFLFAKVIAALISIFVSPWASRRFGIKLPLIAGMLFNALGLTLFARASGSGPVLAGIPSGMLALGIGTGLAYNPIMVAAVEGASASATGAASGIVNTSFAVGGAIGFALVASVAASLTAAADTAGESHAMALGEGYRAAFVIGAVFAAAGAVMAASFKASASRLAPST